MQVLKRLLFGTAVGLLVYVVLPKDKKPKPPQIVSPPPLVPPQPPSGGRMRR